MTCGIFNPGACVTNAVDSIVSLFPYGTLGMAFTAGLIIGAMIGKWGVGALIALVLAVRLGSNRHEPEPTETDLTGISLDDPRPRKVKPRKVRTIFDMWRG